MVGKVRLALGPRVNHWWGVALYVTARGLTTSPIPYGDGAFEIVFDFIDHTLTIEVSDGRRHTIALRPRMVADFFDIFIRALDDLQLRVRIWPMPVEVPEPIRFTEDRVHTAYDADAAHQLVARAACRSTPCCRNFARDSSASPVRSTSGGGASISR